MLPMSSMLASGSEENVTYELDVGRWMKKMLPMSSMLAGEMRWWMEKACVRLYWPPSRTLASTKSRVLPYPNILFHTSYL